MRKGLDKVCEMDGLRVRSVKINELDKLVWDTVVDTLDSSYLFKEIFKKDTMKENKSFGEQRYDQKKIERRIKSNEKTISDIKETISSNVVDGLLDKSDGDQFKTIIKKLEDKKRDLLSENEELKTQLYEIDKSTKWVDWVSDFKERINDLRNTKIPISEQKRFLEGVVDKVIITTKNHHTHNIDIRFKSPYVEDGFNWNVKGNPKKGYTLKNGKRWLITYLNSKNGTKKK